MSTATGNETEDLEALFDRIADQRRTELTEAEAAPAPAVVAPEPAQPDGSADPYDVFKRIGTLTRNLHDALRELGYDKHVEKAVGALPDARDRLTYIANLTGQAAEKALSKSEIGLGIQQQIESDATDLAGRWDALLAGKLGVAEFRDSALKTHEFLKDLPGRTSVASGLFTDIMLAQDFHDLTGQVINKIVTIAQTLEEQLVKLLLDTTPPEARADTNSEWLNGPVVNAKGREDVVTNQGQVDDLLASLGF